MNRADRFLVRRRGRPLVANHDRERCEALTPLSEWKIRNKKEQRCIFVSKYQVNGHQFCRHHAVMEAMALAIEAGTVRRIPRSPQTQDGHVVTIAALSRRKRGK